MEDIENVCYLDENTGDFIIPNNINSSENVYLDEESGKFVPNPEIFAGVLQNIVNIQHVHRNRKRKADPALWQVNIRKKARASGESYINNKGDVVPAKIMKRMCVDCRLNCAERISKEDRVCFFKNYYALDTSNEKYCYLLKYTRTVEPRYVQQDSRRQISRMYFIPTKETENGSELMQRVCKSAFLATLNISDKLIRSAYSKAQSGLPLSDYRGRHVRHRSVIELERRAYVRQHIESFPLDDSHYCRKGNSKKFLSSELSVSKMYDLYMKEMIDNMIDSNLVVTVQKYRKIFNNDFDLHFNKLKKDACDTCIAFKNANASKKADLRDHQDHHIEMKNRARERKAEHKLAAQQSNSVCSSVYDFQKGIQLPKAQASSFYYKRKLVVHNFTVYDLKSKDAFNYVYDETVSGVGPNEVTSFLLMYINQKVASGMNDFRFISDNCSGQNHNQFVFFFYVYMSYKLKIDITHTFLISGHTQNEGDSVHSVIERALGNRTIYTPSEVYDIMRSARKAQPYKVIQAGVNDIYNFKSIVPQNSFNRNTEKKLVKFREIREIYINKLEPGLLRYRYDYDSEYEVIKLFDESADEIQDPVLLRTIPKGLPAMKKKDLESLCKNNLIPTESHSFFSDLEVEEINNNKRKKLKTDPDNEELSKPKAKKLKIR